MLLSLLVYSLTGATLFFLGWHVNRREQRLQLQSGGELPFYSWEIILSLLIFAVVAGARYHTGFDHKMYLDQYLHLQQTGEFGRDNFEYGFEWISKLFAWCHIHYFFYFAFWALLQIGFLYFALRHRKHLLCWVGLGIMCGSYFLWMMNSVRQAVVVCLFVALIPLIKDRKFIPYAIIVIAGAFLHKSALLLLPGFLITFIKVEGKAPNRIAGLLGNIAMIWFYPQLKSHFKDDKLLPYFFILAFIGMCLSNLLMNTTHFILRPIDYFLIFYLVLSAYIMCYLVETKKYLIGIVMALIFYLPFINNVLKAVYRPIVENQPFLYHFFFMPTL